MIVIMMNKVLVLLCMRYMIIKVDKVLNVVIMMIVLFLQIVLMNVRIVRMDKLEQMIQIMNNYFNNYVSDRFYFFSF